jgi:hypothetical protein
VANDFDLHSRNKGKSGQRPPRRDAIPFDSALKGRNNLRPIVAEEAEPKVTRQGWRPRSLAGTGPIFLLGIAILCGLNPSLKYYRKFAAPDLKSREQTRPVATSQPSSPAPALSTQSPIPPAVPAQPERAIMPAQTASAVSRLPGSAALHYHPMTYEATRKKAFGGCTGQLELTSVRLHFKCSHEADLSIPVSSIAKVHKDGVVLASGEKYHFVIANHTKDEVEAIFILWLNKVQQPQQPSRRSSS